MPKILLVEDDNNLREIFEMRLKAEGFDTVVAGNGEEALVVAMKEKPDLIISDVMMPKLSGFEMLETLRAAPEMAAVKAIMMTALGQPEDRARGEKLGVIKYLVKSQVTLEDFVRVVREVIQPSQTATGPTDSSTSPAPTDQVTNNQVSRESEANMPPADQPTTPAPAPDNSGDGANPISGGMPADAQSTEQEQGAVQDQINSFVSGSDDTSATTMPADSSAPAADSSAPTADTSAPAADAGTDATSTPAPEANNSFGGEPAAPAADSSAPTADTTGPEAPASTEPAQEPPQPPAAA